MRIRNHLPILIDCLARWERPPTLADFSERYYTPMATQFEDAFGDARDMHALVNDVDWKRYRAEALKLDPVREEERVRCHLADVERLFGFELQGEIVLFGAFESMDGYARFDRGTHRVFLGVDESHGRGRYMDILEVHELTHVARESRPQPWVGWGLDPKMDHDGFTSHQHAIEHLFGEGFSCAVSGLLVPGEDPWHYAYQETEADLRKVLEHGAAIDRVIHAALREGPDADWGMFYSPDSYKPRLPIFCHYVWAWKWANHLIRDLGGGDAARLVDICSKEWLEDALSFQLKA